ncbi:MAG: M23 family metallopeptidase [Treponema sp.]|jgi:murein DD-endopeptidase MepM/ murein hydrolase activator NlpD|nr:M23 family metallopeptidase [Treponema sp.]
MSIISENGFNRNFNQVHENIFRLIACLCLAFIIMPGFSVKQKEIPAAEHGIGGGDFFQEAGSGDDYGILTSLRMNDFDIHTQIETAVPEPESLSKSRTLFYDSYTVEPGENISGLAIDFGLNQGTIVSVNKISNTRLLQIGKVLKIPNQDGILHAVKKGETISSIAGSYKADIEEIKIANELFSHRLKPGTDLFIPGAQLDWLKLQEINGDLFIWPVNGYITSNYGYRRDPFNASRRQFHSGIDIKGTTGTPIRAAMAGRVSMTGYDRILGNFVIINHHSGYRTVYGHMNVIRTRTGAYVGTGERIGDVGNTGSSTGPHLHFTVYKNGVTVNPRPLIR